MLILSSTDNYQQRFHLKENKLVANHVLLHFFNWDIISFSFVCKHSKQTWTGVPVAVSNMDTTGTFEMALAAGRFSVLTCLHKHYTAAEIIKFAKANAEIFSKFVAVSAGTSDKDFDNVKAVYDALGAEKMKMICLDVANGYSEHFVEAVKRYRAAFPHCTIVAGNVVTGEMTEELILSGADIVKVGTLYFYFGLRS